MRPLLKTPRLGPYRDLLFLLWKYGQRDVLAKANVERPDEAITGQADPADLARDLERLGPTYVKLGQILSGQLNILSKPYVDALSRLQEGVQPFPFEEVRSIVEEDLGGPIPEHFASFDPEPIAAASIGQVHRATLPDGTEVAVKVRRPGIVSTIHDQLDAMEPIAVLLDRVYDGRFDLALLLERTRKTLEEELDYSHELENLLSIRRILDGYPEVDAPEPFPERCSRRVLTMRFIAGKKLKDLTDTDREIIDTRALADRVFSAYLDMVLLEGHFHADPHPGNLRLTDDGRVVLLDMGMTGRVPPRMRHRLIQLVLTIIEGRGEQAADVAIRLGRPTRDFAFARFRAEVAELVAARADLGLTSLGFGETVVQLANLCGRHGLKIPTQVTVLGKTLVQLDQAGRHLDPGFQPAESARQQTRRIARRALRRSVSSRGAMISYLEIKELVETVPNQLGSVLTALSRSDRGLRIDAIDEDRLLHGVDKIANRIAVALVIAAMLVAGALIMHVKLPPTIYEWSVLGAAIVLAALGAGGVLVASFFFDRD